MPTTSITEQEYIAEVLRTYCAPERPTGEQTTTKLTLAALGLAGETGEVVDAIKKTLFAGHDLDLSHLCDELGDILWYFTLLYDALGLSLNEIRQANIDKMHRRFPQGFDADRSRNR